MKKEKTAYEKHLEISVKFWQRIVLSEREKNIKLEKIIKDIENKIYGLKGGNK